MSALVSIQERASPAWAVGLLLFMCGTYVCVREREREREGEREREREREHKASRIAAVNFPMNYAVPPSPKKVKK